MKKRIFLLIAVVVAMFVNSCASIVHGSRQNIIFRSSPDNATVEVYNRYGQNVASAITPATIRFKRGSGYFRGAYFTVTISKDGYETRTVNIRARTNGWYWGGNFSLFTYGLFGWLIVDPMTGAMWTLKPDNIDVNLQRSISFDNSYGEDGIFVVLKEQIPEDVFATLDLVPIR